MTKPDNTVDVPVRVVSKKDGFRRAGMEHHGTVVHPPGTFTEAQLEALKKEPMLVVDVAGEGPPEDDEKKAPTKATAKPGGAKKDTA